MRQLNALARPQVGGTGISYKGLPTITHLARVGARPGLGGFLPAVFLEPVVEGLEADAEDLGRLCLVPVAVRRAWRGSAGARRRRASCRHASAERVLGWAAAPPGR